MACALAAGSRHITLVDSHPERARITAEHYRTPVVGQEPRQFLSRSTDRYDVIQVESWGTSLPGSAALSQEYLLTIDALSAYLDAKTANTPLTPKQASLFSPDSYLAVGN